MLNQTKLSDSRRFCGDLGITRNIPLTLLSTRIPGFSKSVCYNFPLAVSSSLACSECAWEKF
jgi:hypothetical protein